MKVYYKDINNKICTIRREIKCEVVLPTCTCTLSKAFKFEFSNLNALLHVQVQVQIQISKTTSHLISLIYKQYHNSMYC